MTADQSHQSPRKSPLAKLREQMEDAQFERYERVEKMLTRMESKDADNFRNYDLLRPQLAKNIKDHIHQIMLPAWKALQEAEQKGSTQEKMDEILEKFTKATGHLDEEFLPFFWQILTTYGRDEKGVDLMDTYQLAVGAKGIIDAFEKGYKEIHRKILDHEELTQAETEKLISDLKPFIEETPKGGRQQVSTLETLRRSGPWTMIQAMDSAQRTDFAEKFIKARPNDGENFLRGLVAGNLLDLAAMKRLWSKNWGKCPEEEMRDAQYQLEQESKARQERIMSQSDDGNKMVQFFEPKNLLGVGMQVWGGIEVFLNGATMLYKKDWGGFVSNPYFIGGGLAVMAGRGLTQQGSLTAFLDEPSAHQKEQEQYKANKDRIAALILRHSATYAAVDPEVLMKIVRYKRANNKDLKVTLKEVIANMEEKNRKSPNAAYAKKIAALRALQKDEKNAARIEEMLSLIAQTPTITEETDLAELEKESFERKPA